MRNMWIGSTLHSENREIERPCGYCMRKVQEHEGHIHRSYKTVVLDLLESNDQADRPKGKVTMTKACINYKSELLKS